MDAGDVKQLTKKYLNSGSKTRPAIYKVLNHWALLSRTIVTEMHREGKFFSYEI